MTRIGASQRGGIEVDERADGHPLRPAVARVVDQDVDRSELLHGGADLGQVGDVEREGEGLPPCRLKPAGNRTGPVGDDVVHRDHGTLFCEGARNRLADVLPGTRHESDPSV